jgi:uracil-DNA glycosylase
MFRIRIVDNSPFEEINKDWNIYQISKKFPPNSWEKVFKEAKNELKDVSEILQKDEEKNGEFFPLKSDIFRAFYLTPLTNTKVVIIGQDPYHNNVFLNGKTLPRAVGMSFSVRRDDAIPSSLQNIFTELSNTVKGFKPPCSGDLSTWAYQGVLLLNTCLTVRPGKPGSHGEIWLGFIYRVFKAISEVNPSCIFLLWGKEAQKLKTMIGEKSVILEAAHPSGFSARRGFFGCNHFNEVNKILLKQGKSEIKWGKLYDKEKSETIGILSTIKKLDIKPEAPPISTNISKPIIPLIVFSNNNSKTISKIETISEDSKNNSNLPLIEPLT